jgi:hypothetical protein
MDIIGMIQSVFGFGKSVLDRILQKEKLINDPKIQDNKSSVDQTKNSDDNKKEVANAEKTGDISEIIKRAGIIIFALVLLSGCAQTYVPVINHDRVASFDGNIQNSGIVGVCMSGGFIVSDKVFIKYNGLIEKYGDKFVPVLKKDFGLTPSKNTALLKTRNGKQPTPWVGDSNRTYYNMTSEAMVHFLDMNDWENSGIKPKSFIDKVKDVL